MPGSISPATFCRISTRSSGWAAALLLAALLPGCRRPAATAPPFTNGYVRLDALSALHPGWSEVRRLDELIGHAKSLPIYQLPASAALPQAKLPAPLPPEQPAPTHAGFEQQRIEQVREPARKRVSNLRNTLEARLTRDVARQQLEIEAAAAVEARRAEDSLLLEERVEKENRQNQANVQLDALDLQLIAVDSQIQAYRIGPQKDVAPIIKHRDELRAKRDEIATAVKRDLEIIDARFRQRIADSRTRIDRDAAKKLADYRRQQQQAAEAQVRESENVIGFVMSALDPLRPPQAAPGPARLALHSPAEVQARASATPATAVPAAQKAIASLTAERDRLRAFIEADVKRRVERAAVQRNWRLVFAAAPGLTDLTGPAVDILKSEFRP